MSTTTGTTSPGLVPRPTGYMSAGTLAEPRLELRHVALSMVTGVNSGSPQPVLADISLTVRAGEFVAVVGPSGCGKSTLLSVIAGLLSPDSGQVAIDGDSSAPRLGRVALMHQRDLLLPWRTVRENSRLGLELLRPPGANADGQLSALATRFGLSDILEVYPDRLSGGMRQRVALLRTVLPDRPVLLLDEPFGALDAITRAGLQEWLEGVLDRTDKAVVLVTHDVDEALLLADRVYVMSGPPGRFGAVLESQLPRPRLRNLVTTTQFTTLKQQLLDALASAMQVGR